MLPRKESTHLNDSLLTDPKISFARESIFDNQSMRSESHFKRQVFPTMGDVNDAESIVSDESEFGSD